MDFGPRNPDGFDEIETRYTAGWCQTMAIVLHEATGAPLRALWDAMSDEGQGDDPGALIHYYVRLDDGRIADVRGVSTMDEMLMHWGFRVGDLDDEWLIETTPSLDDIMTRCPPTPEDLEMARLDLARAYPEFQSSLLPQP